MQLPRALLLAILSLTTFSAAAPSPVEPHALYVRDARLLARGSQSKPFGPALREPGSPSSPRRPGSPSTPRRMGSDAAAGFVLPPAGFGEHRSPLHRDFRAPGGPVGQFPQDYQPRPGQRTRDGSPPAVPQGIVPVAALAGPVPLAQSSHPPEHEYHLRCAPHRFVMQPKTIIDIGATRCEEVMQCFGPKLALHLASVEGWVADLCRKKCHCAP